MRDSAGNIYGTTYGEYPPGHGGTVYKLSTSGTLSILHQFNCCSFVGPRNLTMDASGTMYGGTQVAGSLFRIEQTGAFTTLATFPGSNGGSVIGRPLLDADGNLFGTTAGGSVFRLGTDGVLTTLLSLSLGDSSYVSSGLTADATGALYGTTSPNGPGGHGTLFRIDGSGFVLSAAPPPPPAVVPEPATWAMLIVGFGLVGAMRRRRARPYAALD